MAMAGPGVLEDRFACVDLVYRLARAIDRCDEALMRAAFWPDATDDHGIFVGSAADFVDWVLPLLQTMERTHHFIGNMLFEVAGDHAAGESYFVAHHALRNDRGELMHTIAAGRYLDRFERRAGEWRIARRLAAYDWNEARPSTDAWIREPSGAWTFGARGEADPSYAHFALLRAA
jgi:SnoaL-like domain